MGKIALPHLLNLNGRGEPHGERPPLKGWLPRLRTGIGCHWNTCRLAPGWSSKDRVLGRPSPLRARLPLHDKKVRHTHGQQAFRDHACHLVQPALAAPWRQRTWRPAPLRHAVRCVDRGTSWRSLYAGLHQSTQALAHKTGPDAMPGPVYLSVRQVRHLARAWATRCSRHRHRRRFPA